MTHELYTVTRFERIAPFTLRVFFDDGTDQTIDFRPLLWGEIFEPLRDAAFFHQVRVDPESGTLTWPNGADFDPETLHNWPKYAAALAARPSNAAARSNG
jgi:hypothetical protein